MKIKYAKFIFTVVLCLVMFLNMIFLAFDGLRASMENLPKGILVHSAESSDKKMVLNMYKAELNGVGTAVRGEIILKDGSLKNIYWDIGQTEVIAFWTGKNTVYINGNNINIYGTAFDSRVRIELPEASYKNIENKMRG
jgi:hypothetical protein